MPESLIERSAVLGSVLDGFGYKYQRRDAGGDLRFRLFTEAEVSWRAQFLLSRQADLLRLIVYLTDTPYREDRQHEVGDLVHRLNDDIVVIGNFALSLYSGGVTFRSSLDLRRQSLDACTVENLLNTSSFPIRVWSHAYALVRTGGSARSALNAALVLVGDFEDAFVTRAVRKMLLRVERGGTHEDVYDAPNVGPALSIL